MKSCGYEKWIHRFIDDELDKKDRDEFEKHLSSCNSCREEMYEIKNIRGLLSCAREDLSLPELKYKIMERIEEAENSFMERKFQLALLYGKVAPVLVAVTMLFIAVSVWDMGRFHSETDSAIAFLEERDIQPPEFELDIL